MRNILSVVAKHKSKYKKNTFNSRNIILFLLTISALATIFFFIENKTSQIKQNDALYEKPIAVTPEETAYFVKNSMTELQILNKKLRNHYGKITAENTPSSIKISEKLKDVVVWRELICALNRYIYRNSGNLDEANYTKQQKQLEDIVLNKNFAQNDIVLSLYSSILNLSSTAEIRKFYTSFVTNLKWTQLTAKEKLELLVIKHQSFDDKITYIELKTINYDQLELLDQIEYVNILLGEIKYIKKIFKNPYKNINDFADKIIESKYPAYIKMEYIASVVKYDVLHNNSANNRNIRKKLDDIYESIDQKNDLGTYASYLNFAYVFALYKDIDYAVSYFLDAFEYINSFPILESNYFTFKSMVYLYSIFVASHDYYGALELYNNYNSFNYETKFFNGKSELTYIYRLKQAFLSTLYGEKNQAKNIKLIEALLHDISQSFYPLHSLYIEALNLLASTQIKNEEYTSGIENLDKVFALLKQKKQENTQQHLSLLTNYAVALEKADRQIEAKKSWRKIYKLSKKLLEKGSPLISYSKEKAEI